MNRKMYVKPRTDVVEVLVENDVLGIGVGSGGAEEALSKENFFDWDSDDDGVGDSDDTTEDLW